jgi:hypothetical protein
MNEATEQLFNLDRKLKTGKYESQLEALSCFPNYIKTYQHNQFNALLRLIDYFCHAKNDLRWEVVQTFKALKIKEVEFQELVDRLGTVWDSNDSVGRAFVIEIYGILGCDCAEAIYRTQISLASEYFEERDAAVETAKKFVLKNQDNFRHFCN